MRRLLCTMSLVVVGMTAWLGLVSAPAYALNCLPNDTTPQCEVCNGAGTCANDNGKQLNDFITAAVNILSSAVGVAAVIMIIVSGFRFVTAGGDTGKVTGAKSGLIYAIVGLVVVALAQFIVRFVLGFVLKP